MQSYGQHDPQNKIANGKTSDPLKEDGQTQLPPSSAALAHHQ
jgi:hypothetical protein